MKKKQTVFVWMFVPWLLYPITALGNETIEVVVGYTKRAQSEAGDIKTEIETAVERINNAFNFHNQDTDDSNDVLVEFELTAEAEPDINESLYTHMDDLWRDVQHNKIATLLTWNRFNQAKDLAILVVGSESHWDKSGTSVDVIAKEPYYATTCNHLVLVAWDSMKPHYFTLMHEFAHFFGAQHSNLVKKEFSSDGEPYCMCRTSAQNGNWFRCTLENESSPSSDAKRVAEYGHGFASPDCPDIGHNKWGTVTHIEGTNSTFFRSPYFSDAKKKYPEQSGSDENLPWDTDQCIDVDFGDEHCNDVFRLIQEKAGELADFNGSYDGRCGYPPPRDPHCGGHGEPSCYGYWCEHGLQHCADQRCWYCCSDGNKNWICGTDWYDRSCVGNPYFSSTSTYDEDCEACGGHGDPPCYGYWCEDGLQSCENEKCWYCCGDTGNNGICGTDWLGLPCAGNAAMTTYDADCPACGNHGEPVCPGDQCVPRYQGCGDDNCWYCCNDGTTNGICGTNWKGKPCKNDVDCN